MKVLIVGAGAREHCLVWKLAHETGVSGILCAPGNAGIATLARCLPVDPGDPQGLLDLAEREGVGLTVVGPEVPLTRGIVDLFAARGRLAFGPTRQAAEIESSKVFAKQFMSRHHVPTAACRVCETAEQALGIVEGAEFGFPVVLKADGLAAGKGVTIAQDRETARAAVQAMMVDRTFGTAGARLVVEECLEGPEVSFFVITDGSRAVALPTAQDHKRAFDEDQGPNTGGMGAFAPSPLIDARLHDRILEEAILPVIEGLRHEQREYRGVLYAGLMLTKDGPKVLEFNARFGDPETQVVVPMLDEDLLPLLLEAASGKLERSRCRFRPEPHVGVVLASGGYPGSYRTGEVISGLPAASAMRDVTVFHAGTAERNGDVVTAGGRVLTVVGRGAGFKEAIDRAYCAVAGINFEGLHFRRDIGAKALVPSNWNRTGHACS
jgi:phosphoribosylamine---glycine ligase